MKSLSFNEIKLFVFWRFFDKFIIDNSFIMNIYISNIQKNF